jgi:hypothetical protein
MCTREGACCVLSVLHALRTRYKRKNRGEGERAVTVASTPNTGHASCAEVARGAWARGSCGSSTSTWFGCGIVGAWVLRFFYFDLVNGLVVGLWARGSCGSSTLTWFGCGLWCCRQLSAWRLAPSHMSYRPQLVAYLCTTTCCIRDQGAPRKKK